MAVKDQKKSVSIKKKNRCSKSYSDFTWIEKHSAMYKLQSFLYKSTALFYFFTLWWNGLRFEGQSKGERPLKTHFNREQGNNVASLVLIVACHSAACALCARGEWGEWWWVVVLFLALACTTARMLVNITRLRTAYPLSTLFRKNLVRRWISSLVTNKIEEYYKVVSKRKYFLNDINY